MRGRRCSIFVPNIGFGGGGQGADIAGEVSYIDDFAGYEATEVLQYTYGPGAIGGGLGRKRIAELVAYGFATDFRPYYRFLHEDTMGSTLATTDQWGDRRDEYDHTDYGVPLHAPIALDGKYINNVTPHPSRADVSVATLNLPADPNRAFPDDNELLGCEFRLVKGQPGGALDVYVTGTVIAQKGTVMHIHDPGHAISTAWSAPGGARADVFDLREGFFKGVINSVIQGSGNPDDSPPPDYPTWTHNGWGHWSPPKGTANEQLNGEPCTYIKVDMAPFGGWIGVTNRDGPTGQSGKTGDYLTEELYVHLGPNGEGEYEEFLVIGFYDIDGNTGYQSLVVQGDATEYAAAGDWYYIDGKRDKRHAAQSGRWAQSPPDSTGATTATTFTLDECAALTEEMLGWMLQPDVNEQVYLPITSVDPDGNTVTVAGDYKSIGSKDTAFRIFAPPGVERSNIDVSPGIGALTLGPGGASSRHLYAGYRYESPLAGIYDEGTEEIEHRQTGKNFAGVRAANAPERRNAPQGKLHAVPALRPGADALHLTRPGRESLLQPVPLRRKQPRPLL